MSSPDPSPLPDPDPVAEPGAVAEVPGDGAAPAPRPPEVTPEERELVAEAPTLCLNCGARLPGAFCPRCGQRSQSLRVPAHRFVRDALSELFGLDGRVWRTYGMLLFRPGALTAEYLKGRRRRSLSPLRVYIASTLLFFILLSALDPVGRVSELLGARPDGRDADSLVVAGDELARVLQQASTSDSLDAGRTVALRDTTSRIRSEFAARRTRDSLAQARTLAVAESTLAVLSADPANDGDARTAERQAETAREELAERLERLDDELDEALEEAIDDHDDGLSSRERLALDVEAAILRVLPPDSLVRLGDIEAARAQVVPEVRNNVGLPEWMPQSSAVERVAGARDRTEQRAALTALGREAIGQIPTAIFLLLPLFALLLKLVYVRGGWYYSEHLVFGLHVHAAAFMMLTFAIVASAATGGAGVNSGASQLGDVLVNGFLFYIPVYYLVASWRVYRQGALKTLAKSVVVGWVYGLCLVILGLTLTLALTVVTR